MSANALFVSVLVVLAAAAAALRLAAGPMPLAHGDTLYARAKAGPVPDALATPVELAARGAQPGR